MAQVLYPVYLIPPFCQHDREGENQKPTDGMYRDLQTFLSKRQYFHMRKDNELLLTDSLNRIQFGRCLYWIRRIMSESELDNGTSIVCTVLAILCNHATQEVDVPYISFVVFG